MALVKTSTGKTAKVGSRHVIAGRNYEVLANGKMKDLGKVSAAPAVPARRPDTTKAAPKAAATKKVAAVKAPAVPARRPDTPKKSSMLPDGRKDPKRPMGFAATTYTGPGKPTRRGYKTGGGF